MFAKKADILTIVKVLMNFTDNVSNIDGLSPQKLRPFFTTVNSLFLKHFISYIMFLQIRMVSVEEN